MGALGVMAAIDGSVVATEILPRWAPWVALVPLPGSRLYVASDPDLSCVLEGVDSPVQDWLAQLDGNRAWIHQVAEADARGIDVELADRLLTDLWAAGLLSNAAIASVTLADHGIVLFGSGVLSEELRRLTPGTSWAGPIPRPRKANDLVSVPNGADRAVHKARIALLVLQGVVADSIEVAFAQRLQAAGAVVLVVGAGSRSGRVGPLTVPDLSPCLRCEDLERATLDADWPAVARELALGSGGVVDPLIAAATAAEAVRQLREYLAACQVGPVESGRSNAVVSVLSGVLELGPVGSTWTHRELQPNRSCGCWWSD